METISNKTEGTVNSMVIKIRREEFLDALKRAYLDHTDQYPVPGFAPGLAPREAIEELYGSDALCDEALELCIPGMYRAALETAKIRIIGKPEVTEVTWTNDGSVLFRVKAEVYPNVELGQYKGLRVDVPKENPREFSMAVLRKACENLQGEVSDSMVESKLDALAAQEKLRVNGDAIYHLLSDTTQVLDEAYKATGVTRPGPQVRSEAMDIMLQTVSASNENPSEEFLVGQIVNLAGQYRNLPEDFEEQVKTLFERCHARKTELSAEERATDAFNAYLGSIGLNEETWRAERRQQAAESARCDLLLDAVAREEGLSLEEGEIDEMVWRIASQCGAKPEQLKREMDLEPVKMQLLRDKAHDLIIESAIGSAAEALG